MSTVAAAVSDADHIKLKQTKTRPDRAGFCSGEQFLAKLVKAALPSTTENQRSYVEWLDGEAVENVVRHLSSKANRSQWSRFVSCRVLVSFSRLGDRFRGASLAVLEKLDTGSSIYSKDGCDVPLSELRDVLHAVEDKLKELHFSRYYKMKGSSVRLGFRYSLPMVHRCVSWRLTICRTGNWNETYSSQYVDESKV